MPPKGRKFSRQRFTKRNGQKSRGDFSAKQRTCRSSGIENSWYLSTNTGTSGLLSSGTATITSTTGVYTCINASTIGLRAAKLANLYNEYKINSLTVKYKPAMYNVGFTQYNQAIQAVAGFVLDPVFGSLTQNELVECGGRNFSVDRPFTWKLRNTKWMYTNPVSFSGTDIRFASPGNFYALSYENGGDTQISFGILEIYWDISFRFAADPDRDIPPAAEENLAALKSAFRPIESKTSSPVVVPPLFRPMKQLLSQHFDDDLEQKSPKFTPKLRVDIPSVKKSNAK